MRIGFVLFLVCLACGTRTPPARNDNVEDARRELARVEDEWERALKAHDEPFFQRTMSNDFIGTTLDGISDKPTLVRINADTSVTVDSVGRSDEKIRIYGNGTVAVITGRFGEVGHLGLRRLSVEFRYTEVWVKEGDQWQVVAGHYTPVEKAKK